MNCKRPTVRQKKIMVAAGYEPKEWLIFKEAENTLVIKSKKTGKTEIIVKGDYE